MLDPRQWSWIAGPHNCVLHRLCRRQSQESIMESSPIYSREDAQHQARENLNRDLRAALDDAEELVRLTAEQAGERITTARNRAKESLAQARVELDRVQAQTLERAKQAAHEVDDYVHSHPWQAMALAGVLSAVIGVLIARR